MAKKKLVYSGSASSTKEREDILEISDKIRGLVKKAQYRKAFNLAEATLKAHPKNRFAQYHYAVMLGDSEEWATKAQHIKNSKRAAKLLQSLLKRSRGIDPRWRMGWRNEYYWFTKQAYKQWRLGVEGIRRGDKTSYYSMGVGAVSLSLNFYKNNSPKRAKSWALKAINAWESYFKVIPDYYNSYVWYAKGLGLSGNLVKMNFALRKAANLSGRPISYREFVDARAAVLKAIS